MAKNKRKPRSFVKSKKSRNKTYKMMNNNREVLKECS